MIFERKSFSENSVKAGMLKSNLEKFNRKICFLCHLVKRKWFAKKTPLYRSPSFFRAPAAREDFDELAKHRVILRKCLGAKFEKLDGRFFPLLIVFP